MATSEFDALIGKVLSDETFAANLVSSPEATLTSAGIEPTPEMLDALKGVDVASLRNLVAAFSDGQAAAAAA
ncbi:MAG: hypothetical protein JNM26_00560 [Ideonella sp.]|nr:hypothetical protein [Ideonella sp.]